MSRVVTPSQLTRLSHVFPANLSYSEPPSISSRKMVNNVLSARGFSAWITVEGDPLPIYQEETVNTTCSAWIASCAGKDFSVWWKDDSKSRIATSGHIFIDGHDVASAISRPGRTKPVERTGAKTSARRLKPFHFDVLRLTGKAALSSHCLVYVLNLHADDDTIASVHDASLHDMGTIKIEISRVKLGDAVPFKGYEAEDRGLVHERAKKLGAHCTSYGPDMRAEGSRTVAVSTAPYDPDTPGPYVTFLFRYRSEDLLHANGVIGNGERKRQSSDNEVIEISDSESEHGKPEGPPKKRARKDVDDVSSGGLSSKEDAYSDAIDEAEPEPNSATEFATGPLGEIEGGAPGEGSEKPSRELGLGTPSLLQSKPDNMAASPAAEESQTQADLYTEIGFGAPSALLHDTEEATDGPIIGMSRTIGVDSDTWVHTKTSDTQEPNKEESQLQVDAAI